MGDELFTNLMDEDENVDDDSLEMGLSPETLFLFIHITHILCGIGGVVEKVLKRHSSYEVWNNFFGNIIGNTLYMGMIIYCIF